MLWLCFAAFAELPPPDYRLALAEAAGVEIVRAREREGAAAAEAVAKRWERSMGESARVSYEVGLGYRLEGDEDGALRFLTRSVQLDAGFVPAHYDRGEVLLLQGELDKAEADFLAVVALWPTAWPGWFRLADVAGRRGDAAKFEKHLLMAFRYGFQARSVAVDPTWRGFLSNPEVGPILRRLVEVYQGREVLLEFMEPPATAP